MLAACSTLNDLKVKPGGMGLTTEYYPAGFGSHIHRSRGAISSNGSRIVALSHVRGMEGWACAVLKGGARVGEVPVGFATLRQLGFRDDVLFIVRETEKSREIDLYHADTLVKIGWIPGNLVVEHPASAYGVRSESDINAVRPVSYQPALR